MICLELPSLPNSDNHHILSFFRGDSDGRVKCLIANISISFFQIITSFALMLQAPILPSELEFLGAGEVTVSNCYVHLGR